MSRTVSAGVANDPGEGSSGSPAVVVVAASAGGVSALSTVVGGLPADLPVPLVVVQHVDPTHVSRMVQILGARAQVRVCEVVDGMALKPGTVHMAPPDHHVEVGAGPIASLTQTERVHFVRPSADVLFASAAASLGEGVLAVVLTGSGVDGATGSRAVKDAGGTLIVQEAESAEFSGMPAAAVRAAAADRVLPLARIAPAIVELANTEGAV